MKKIILAGMAALIISGCSNEKESSSEPQDEKPYVEIEDEKKGFDLPISEEVRSLKIEIKDITVDSQYVIVNLKLDNTEESAPPVNWDPLTANIVIDNTQLNAYDSSINGKTETNVIQDGDILFDTLGSEELFEEGKKVTLNLGEFEIGGYFPESKEITTSGVLE